MAKAYYHGSAAINALFERVQARRNGGAGQEPLFIEMKRLYGAVDALANIAANRDTTKPPDSHVEQVSRAAAKLSENLPAVRERLAKHIATARAGFQSAFIQNSGLRQTETATELRALVRAMGPGERMQFVQNAIKTRDGEALGALLLVPHYLSGLDPAHPAQLRDQYFKTVVPEAWQASQDFEKIAEAAVTAFSVAERAVQDFNNPEKLRAIENTQALAAASQANLKNSLGGQ